MLKQRTLKTAIKTTGVGVHTGARVDLGLRPAPADSGIVFNRTDLPQAVAIPALAANVGDTRLSSTLKHGGTSISTVEHLMSALAGVGIDNLFVDVSGPEIPISSGSMSELVRLATATMGMNSLAPSAVSSTPSQASRRKPTARMKPTVQSSTTVRPVASCQ